MGSIKSVITVVTLLLILLSLNVVYFACGPDPIPANIPSPQSAASPAPPVPVASVEVQFLGQSCFLITASTGLRIITDPYTVSNTLNYSPVDETADIVTVSHEHADHNNITAVKGQPAVVKGVEVKAVKGIEFNSIATWHDSSDGTKRGPNTVFIFSVDGVKLCHLGDLGQRLSSDQVVQIGSVDILFIPVGGNYTIDAKIAAEICNDLKPKVIIPMHYKTLKASLPIAGVEDFLQGKENVKRLNSSIFQWTPGNLPTAPQIILIDPSR